MTESIKTFWDWIDDRSVVRRLVLFITLWLTWESFHWAAGYAVQTKLDGLGAAAVIGAVTAPISFLQAAIFKNYSESRK